MTENVLQLLPIHIQERLNEIEKLEDGWAGENSEAPIPFVIETARQTILCCIQKEIPVSQLFAYGDGDLTLYLHPEGTHTLSVLFGDDVFILYEKCVNWKSRMFHFDEMPNAPELYPFLANLIAESLVRNPVK